MMYRARREGWGKRTWRDHDGVRQAVRFGITSVPLGRADAARLLALHRRYWAIENRLHRTKDVNFGEDASLVHSRVGPTVMALLRGHGIQ